MNINKIKNQLLSLKGEKLKVKINLGRNKHEYYEGIIDNLYTNIFTIKTNKGIKSFSYSDVVIKNVIISKFNQNDWY